MKLVDLDPRWMVDAAGNRIGFVFRCPNPKKPWWMSCFAQPTPSRDQWAAFQRIFGEDFSVQGCKEHVGWTIAGDDFATLNVTPSIDGSEGGTWHGYITDGEIINCG